MIDITADDLPEPARTRLLAMPEADRAALLESAKIVVDALWPVLGTLLAANIYAAMGDAVMGQLDDNPSYSPN